jgi:hypothetical protein
MRETSVSSDMLIALDTSPALKQYSTLARYLTTIQMYSHSTQDTRLQRADGQTGSRTGFGEERNQR